MHGPGGRRDRRRECRPAPAQGDPRLDSVTEHFSVFVFPTGKFGVDRVDVLKKLPAEVSHGTRGGILPSCIGLGLNFDKP
jgi:hypothetical protein